MNALDVARAALMEVGGKPDEVWVIPDPLSATGFSMAHASGNVRARKACYLAIMATRGASFLIRCRLCAVGGARKGIPRCTPVGDVLRGVTCGRTQ